MMSRQGPWTIALGCGLVIAFLGTASIAAAQAQSTTLQLAAQNNSGISGTATFTQAAGGVRVDIKVTGAGAGPQPAHIHEGSCAQLNPTPQFALQSVTSGSSTTDLQTTMQALTSTPHAVHLHKSADELSVYVACADINPSALPRTGEADNIVGVASGVAGLSLLVVGLVLRRFAGRRAAKRVTS
jgi:LPXTG-motif cell wall-anchored protein